MSQAGDLFQLRHLVSRALIGGRAPINWQREVGRQMARLDTLRRASAWVEMLAVARPTLRDGPLLGRSLATLTNQGLPSIGAQPEQPQRGLPRFTWPERPLARDWEAVPGGDRLVTPSPSSVPRGPMAKVRASGESPSRLQASVPFQLERGASRALMGRLAGGTAPAEGTSRTRRRLGVEALAPKTTASPGVPRDPASHQDWLHELARRAEHSVHQGGPNVPGTPWRAASDQSEPGKIPSLAAQWAILLNGPPASVDLLTCLASAPVGDGDTFGRKTQREPRPQRLSGARSAGLSGRPIGAPETENDGLGRRGRLESATSRTSTARSSDLPGTPTVEDSRLWQMHQPALTEAASAVTPRAPARRTGGAASAPESRARIAPPTVARSLPPLLPSQEVGRPSPPEAAATVAQGARREEAAAAEEHLSELAAKIKRILDEEARRHGIDA